MKTLYEMKKGELVLKLVAMDDLNIKLEVGYDGEQADAGFYIDLSTDEYLEMLKKLIPGSIDDVLIEAIKAGLK